MHNEEPIKFWCHPLLDPNVGFSKDSSASRAFSTIWLISLDASLNNKVPNKTFWYHTASDLDWIHLGGGLRSPSALVFVVTLSDSLLSNFANFTETYLRKFAKTLMFTVQHTWFCFLELHLINPATTVIIIRYARHIVALALLPKRYRRLLPQSPDQWLSYSLDMHPVDYKVWGMMQKRVHCMPILDVADVNRRVRSASACHLRRGVQPLEWTAARQNESSATLRAVSLIHWIVLCCLTLIWCNIWTSRRN